jgi:hypothetical protein
MMADPALAGRIERYLLGRLKENERSRLEGLIFTDDEVWRAVRDAEDDLIDRYVEDVLSAADREDFERHFLVTASRRTRIAVARALPGVLRVEPPRRAWRAPVNRWSAAAAAAAAAITGLWLAREPSSIPRPSDATSSSAATTAPAAAVLDASVAAPPPGEPPFAALVLGGHLLRNRESGGPRQLWLPDPDTFVRIDVELDLPASAAQAARLRSVEGTELWRGPARLHAGGSVATVVLPASVLATGDYTLLVETEAAAGRHDATEHAFRIRAAPATPRSSRAGASSPPAQPR